MICRSPSPGVGEEMKNKKGYSEGFQDETLY
jgi:hypothetical protein